MSAIVVENISKHWTTTAGKVHAVEGLSFALDDRLLGTVHVYPQDEAFAPAWRLHWLGANDH